MIAHNQRFENGKLIWEEFVEVPDPGPTEEDLLNAAIEAKAAAIVEARFAKLKDALAESHSIELKDLGSRIAAKDAVDGIPVSLKPIQPAKR